MIECKCGFKFYVPEMRRTPISQPHPPKDMEDITMEQAMSMTYTVIGTFNCPKCGLIVQEEQ